MVAYTFYEFDNRVRRYAETLAKRGDRVDAITLRRDNQPSREIINGVFVFRVQKRVVNETRKISYLFRLLLFFFRSTALLTRQQVQSPYDLIHVHSVPDFEVFAAWLPKLMGAKIILDLHEILPEFYISKFHGTDRSLVYKLLVMIERLSAAFSDHVIVPNHLCRRIILSRSVRGHKCSVILNFPDTSLFCRHGRKQSNGKFIILYPGTLSHHQGVDIAIRAFARIKEQVPDAEFHIYGEGGMTRLLKRLIAELGLEGRVFLRGFAPFTEMPAIIENADLGVVPKRKEGYGQVAFSTKILEFMSMGVPVIVSDTEVDKYYFDESLVTFFQSDDEKHLADCMLLLIQDGKLRRRLVSNAKEFIKKNNWEVKKAEYLKLVDEHLISTGSS